MQIGNISKQSVCRKWCLAVRRRERMSDAQRILVALLVRAGASTEALKAEDALRP